MDVAHLNQYSVMVHAVSLDLPAIPMEPVVHLIESIVIIPAVLWEVLVPLEVDVANPTNLWLVLTTTAVLSGMSVYRMGGVAHLKTQSHVETIAVLQDAFVELVEFSVLFLLSKVH